MPEGGNLVLEAADLAGLGPFRLLCIPSGQEFRTAERIVPIDAWIAHAQQTRTGLDDLDHWQDALARLGVGPDALTLVADDGRMTEAARVWFILQYFGLPAAVLNGGLDPSLAVPPQAPDFAGTLSLCPGSGPVGLRAREDLKRDLGRVQVFDARSAGEYRGEDRRGNSRGGHLPGARHVAHDALLDGHRLRPAAEIAAILDAAGLDGAGPIVSHCNGGGRAALAALAALMAGRTDVEVYYLSFADWAADETCPVRQG